MAYRWIGSGEDLPALADDLSFPRDVQRNLALFKNNPQSNISFSKAAVVCINHLYAEKCLYITMLLAY